MLKYSTFHSLGIFRQDRLGDHYTLLGEATKKAEKKIMNKL